MRGHAATADGLRVTKPPRVPPLSAHRSPTRGHRTWAATKGRELLDRGSLAEAVRCTHDQLRSRIAARRRAATADLPAALAAAFPRAGEPSAAELAALARLAADQPEGFDQAGRDLECRLRCAAPPAPSGCPSCFPIGCSPTGCCAGAASSRICSAHRQTCSPVAVSLGSSCRQSAGGSPESGRPPLSTGRPKGSGGPAGPADDELAALWPRRCVGLRECAAAGTSPRPRRLPGPSTH
jgi:hypothetical protein